jgi:hypothetical protein
MYSFYTMDNMDDRFLASVNPSFAAAALGGLTSYKGDGNYPDNESKN